MSNRNMSNRNLPRVCGLVLGFSMIMAIPAGADPLKDEIAPTGKLRVAIAISPAGGAFWSTKTETGYAGVPVDRAVSAAQSANGTHSVTGTASGVCTSITGAFSA